jgi:hypothetical protein
LTEKTETAPPAKPEPAAKQVAVKTGSVEARFLHEGGGIVTLHKAWDSEIRDFLILPWYSGQDPSLIKPAVWMTWRHELKAPLGGHSYVRDCARVLDSIPLHSAGALDILDSEYAPTLVEARRRYESGKPGLVALVLRVYHLPRSCKLYNVASLESEAEVLSIALDVGAGNLTPAVPDDEFERRRGRILKTFGRGSR